MLPEYLANKMTQWNQAIGHYEDGDFATAKELFAALSQRDPEDGPSRSMAGICDDLITKTANDQ